ncbi:hypothetical protein R6Q59_024408 [Mikania micrantha]
MIPERIRISKRIYGYHNDFAIANVYRRCFYMSTINRLPSTIIEKIQCLVPLKDAARSSTHYKEWMCHWAKIP